MKHQVLLSSKDKKKKKKIKCHLLQFLFSSLRVKVLCHIMSDKFYCIIQDDTVLYVGSG